MLQFLNATDVSIVLLLWPVNVAMMWLNLWPLNLRGFYVLGIRETSMFWLVQLMQLSMAYIIRMYSTDWSLWCQLGLQCRKCVVHGFRQLQQISTIKCSISCLATQNKSSSMNIINQEWKPCFTEVNWMGIESSNVPMTCWLKCCYSCLAHVHRGSTAHEIQLMVAMA